MLLLHDGGRTVDDAVVVRVSGCVESCISGVSDVDTLRCGLVIAMLRRCNVAGFRIV